MRVTRNPFSWTLHAEAPAEERELHRAIALTKPGDRWHWNDSRRRADGTKEHLITAGGGQESFTTDNLTRFVLLGGVNLIAPGAGEFAQFISTMKICGLQYVGTTADGGIELYGTQCKICHVRLLNADLCCREMCLSCIAKCEHDWRSGRIVPAADGGLAICDRCRICDETSPVATGGSAEVERTAGIMIVGPDTDLAETVATLLAPDPRS
jgi:hypothetical protein